MPYQTNLEPLRLLLKKWGVEHFIAEEFTSLHNTEWEGPRHACPPPDLLGNMEDTAKLVELVRVLWAQRFPSGDARVRIVSGYRPPAYNKLVGGAGDSQHKHFRACDLQPYNGSIGEFTALIDSMVETLALYKPTGLGKYNTFVHVDVGAEIADKRRWDNRKNLIA